MGLSIFFRIPCFVDRQTELGKEKVIPRTHWIFCIHIGTLTRALPDPDCLLTAPLRVVAV